jgi:alkylation response protein AidB-like acyl-CoA dehydrogenase
MTEFDELLDVLRDFIRREVMPAEAGIDESDEIPARLIAQAKEMGLYGYALPTEYGGLGLSVEQQVRVTIELGYTCPAFRSLFGTNDATTSPEASRGSQCLRCCSVPARTRTWPAIPLLVPNSDRNAGHV